MAAILHDPNNHAPPVSAADVWADCEAAAPVPRRAAGLALPEKRVACAHATANSRKPVPQGLHIDVCRLVPNASPALERAGITEYNGAVVRLEQALDELPFQALKVIPAMALIAPEPPREQRVEELEWGKTRHHPLRWLMIAGASTAVLLVAALTAQESLLTTTKKERNNHLELAEDIVPEEVKGFECDGTSEANARAMVAAYATVTAEGGREHGSLRGRKPDFSPYQVYFVREGDCLRIDWEATQGLGETSFDSLQRGVGSGGVIRAYATPGTFYSLAFPETEYRSYKVIAPDREQVVWGYLRTDSAAAAALKKAFEPAERGDATGSELPVTLRLAPPPAGAQKNQWLIGEMLHIDWVCP